MLFITPMKLTLLKQMNLCLKNKLMIKTCYTFLFVFYFSLFFSQEFLGPLHSNINYLYGDLKPQSANTNMSASAQKSQASGLLLPFQEDFFYSSTSQYPDQSKWSDSMVYVNSGFPIAPPSIGVATFDGLNKHGFPYGPELTNLVFSYPADTLTSQPINLYTSATQQTLDPFSDVALSFYYQARGNGDPPEVGDSLIVDLYKPLTKKWTSKVWFAKGNSNSNINDTVFKRAFIRVKDTAYFHEGFKFRFRNRASITGNFDHWHVDYIFLDQGRGDSLFDTVRNDITIAEIPTPFLKNYSSMPFQQYTTDEMASKLSVRIRNNSATQPNVGYKYQIYNKSNNLVFTEYDGGYANLNPYKPNTFSPPDYGYSNIAPHAFPAVKDTFALMPTDSTDYRIKHFVFLNTGTLSSNDFNLNNDTVTQNLCFRNYYAFDDGSAEGGYFLNGVGGKVALKITLNKPDTLRALRIYFDPVGNVNSISGTNSTYFFSLNVWSATSAGLPSVNLILKDSTPNRKPIYYKTGHKEIPEYKLTKALGLPAGTYFIGIQQRVAAGISVGFDKNYNHKNSLYYDVGLGWTASDFKGSLMIHPVFGDIVFPPVGIQEINKNNQQLFIVYPNPAMDQFTIHSYEAGENSYQLLNSLGQVVQLETFNTIDHTVLTEHLSSGVYILILQNNKRQVLHQQKIIIQH
jgi:hypothetical protein